MHTRGHERASGFSSLAARISGIASRLKRLPQSTSVPGRLFERPIEYALAIAALVFLQRPIVELFETPSPLMRVGLCVIIAAQLLVAIDCLRPRNRGWLVVALSALGAALLVAGQYGQGDGTALWRTDVWLGTQLIYLALLHPRRWPLPTLGVIAVGGFVTLGLTLGLNWKLQLLSNLFLAASIVLLALGKWLVTALADDYRNSKEAHQRELQASAETRAHADALAAIRRDAHDSILHSLQLVAGTTAGLPESDVRASCRRTRQTLSGLPHSVANDSANLDAELRAALVDQNARLTWDLARVSVPRAVADALLGASLEAVRNIAKHAPAAQASLTLRSTPDAVRVEINDNGPGFDPAALPAGRFGIRESINERVASVGGIAEVASDGSGTSVTLSWPAPEPKEPAPLGPRARAALSIIPLPLLFSSLIHIAVTHPGMTTAQAFIGWGVMACIVVLAGHRVRTVGLRDREAWLLCGLALASLLYNYLMLGSLEVDAWAIWTPSLAGAMALLALPGRRVTTALCMATLLVGGHVLMSSLRLGVQTTFIGHFGAIISLGIDVVVVLVVVFSTAAVSRHEWRVRQQVARLAHQRRITAEREGIWGDWLARADRLAGDFLAGVADGRLPVGDPATVREALRLEARMRDELRLWPGDAGIAVELDRLRRLGWQCRFDLESPDAVTRAELAGLLRQLSSAEPTQQLTVSPRGGGAVVTIAPALSTTQLEEVAAWVRVADPDFTQLHSSQRRKAAA